MASHLDKYIEQLVQSLNSSNDEIELEIRFRQSFEEGNFFKEFTRVKKYLESLYGVVEPVRTEDLIKEDKVKGKIRQTLVHNKYGYSWKQISKNTLWEYIDRDFEFKISTSTETSEDVSSPMSDKDLTRIKERYTWEDTKKYIRYDLTIVNQTIHNTGKTEDRFEIEMECIHPILFTRSLPLSINDITELKSSITNLSVEIFKIRNKITNSDMPYKVADRIQIAKFINYTLNGKKYMRKFGELPKGEMIEDIAVKARNIKYTDIVYGGLLSKSWKKEEENLITKDPSYMGYSVTPKAEGLRKFLVVYDSGIWLVYGREFCRISLLPESWKPYIGTILDGEDIEDKNKRTDYKNFVHFYTPFDTLAFKGVDMTQKPLKVRQGYVKYIHGLGVVQINNRNSLIIETKPFIYFNGNNSSFYNAIKQIMTVKVPYKIDGYVFTPNRCEYNPQTVKFAKNKKDRKLTKYPDIVKWKPLDQLTVDLAYCVSPEGRFLCYSQGNNLIKFEGSAFNPFNPEIQVMWSHPLFNIPGIKQGVIFEFEPYMNFEGVYMLKPKLIRDDKIHPNSRETAESVWNDIHDPISLDTLLGNDIKLTRKYHNSIKKEILSNNIPEGSYLIDIGSGKGGDIDKMSKFSKILCIEPYKPFFDVFKERLSTKSKEFQQRFRTLECGGEETNLILNEIKKFFGNDFGSKPLYISMMLSLSFFWKDANFLKSLVQTINTIKFLYYSLGGLQPIKFIFMTIEGERTYKVLEKYDFDIKKSGYRMSYDKDSEEVSVFIKDTIVGKNGEKQIEYLVNLEQLFEYLQCDIDYLKECKKEELLLSEDEMEYNSMYVYGVATLKNDFNTVVYEPQDSTSTLFDCLFKAIKPEEEYTMTDVLYFRKELSDSISKKNPFDNEQRSFFESAGDGFLSKIYNSVKEAQDYIYADWELPPEYISWIPDMIGYNIMVNNVEYSRSSSEKIPATTDTIKLIYNGKYKLL
jgi:hypothetical protein